MENCLKEIFGVEKPIITVIHLPPLPGSPLYRGEGMEHILECAIKDAKALERGGVDGFHIENFGDKLFYKYAGPETIACMTYVLTKLSDEVGVPYGANVLQADAKAALAIAMATGGKWIRATYYTETYIVDAGLIDSCAAEVLRFRKYMGAEDVKIFADVHIKHAYPLFQRPIGEAAVDMVERALADAVIVTGKATGSPTNVKDVKEVKEALPDTPVLVGSGVTKENLEEFWDFCDGIIIGTHFKVEGITTNPVEERRVRDFMTLVKELRD